MSPIYEHEIKEYSKLEVDCFRRVTETLEGCILQWASVMVDPLDETGARKTGGLPKP